MHLTYLFSIFLTQGLVFTTFLYIGFTTSRASVPMHLVSLSILLTCLILLIKLYQDKSHSLKKTKFLFAFIFSAFNFLLLIFYALTIYGYFHWSAAFTVELLVAYLPQLPTILANADISIFYVYLFFVLMFLSLFWVYYYASQFIVLSETINSQRKSIKLKFRSSEIALQPISWLKILMFICLLGYALTYKAWLPREPFAIAITNNWRLSSLAPSELFSSVASIELLNMFASNETFQTELELRKSSINLKESNSTIQPRPLVLITIDALRSDQMGVYGGSLDNTPFLSSLLKNQQLQKIEVAHSICTLSFCGLLGILRSNDWSGLKKTSPTINEALSHFRYQSIFLLGGDHTNYGQLKTFYGKNIAFFQDGSADSGKHLNDDFAVLKAVRDMQPTDPQATFLFIHLMSVHEAGLRHESFKKWQPSTVPLLAEFTSSKAYEIAYKNNYHNGILQADASIRRIFELLASKGMLERALIIITADHGEYLGEFNRFHHGHTPYEPVSRIPLLIYDPLNPNYPDRPLSSQIDIAPTFLQSIGARIPANWQGVPLQVTTARSSISIASGDTSGVVAIIEGTRYKYIRERNNNIEQLFDLDSPEGEAQNLAKASKSQPLLSKMRSLHKALE